jgi:L-Ala-D/L-Glu epimerase
VRRTVWVRIIDDDGVEGWGEAAANAYYGETADTVIALLPLYERALNAAVDGPTGGDGCRASSGRARHQGGGYNPAARAAVSAALHDLVGKRLGVPSGSSGASTRRRRRCRRSRSASTSPTSCAQAGGGASYPDPQGEGRHAEDRRILELIRDGAPDKVRSAWTRTPAWTAKQALRCCRCWRSSASSSSSSRSRPTTSTRSACCASARAIPVVADESCHVAADIPRLVGCVDGINIKLEKCGSLREAVRMVHVARAHHLQVMIGCMMSARSAMAAAMQVAPLVDWADLDGAALMEQRPVRRAAPAAGGARCVAPRQAAPGRLRGAPQSA